jgi:hypothetical protein
MWFSANILLRCDIGGETSNDCLWQENIVLCLANSLEDAGKKAREAAYSLENEYRSINGELVRWCFDGILNIYQLEDDVIKDNCVVFSRHLTKDEVLSLRKSL